MPHAQPAIHSRFAAALCFIVATLTQQPQLAYAQVAGSAPPYPPSPVIARIVWDWKTLTTSAPGSDLWPVTWANDDNIFTAWGDGGGFGGTDQDGRVALGFARIEGSPEHFTGINVNGGMKPLNPASYPKKGKVGSLLAVGDRIYAWLNTEDGTWPDVDQALIWSDDAGATWRQSDWVFPKGKGNWKATTFLNFGKGYTGVPENLGGYVYFYGKRREERNKTYLARALPGKLTDRRAYEFLSGIVKDQPQWSVQEHDGKPVFSDPSPNGDLAGVFHVSPLGRYLLTSFHSGPGQLGIFDGPQPWGPWSTVFYAEDWGDMGSKGEGLTCSFPGKWMSDDGLTLWCIFSAYGEGARQGINAHDKFNLIKTTLELKQ
jgi:hypothetical protein